MSRIKKAIKKYLELRRSLGHKLRGYENSLYNFAKYLEENNTEIITPAHAVACVQKLVNMPKAYWSNHISQLRGFAKFYKAINPESETIPEKILSFKYAHFIPYIYSDGDVKKILKACDKLQGLFLHSIQRQTFKTLLGLISVTGMRIGEAVRLHDNDIDFEDMNITIKHTKFNKSRNIPVDTSVIDNLKAYRQERDKHFRNTDKSSFFVTDRAKPLGFASLWYMFKKVLAIAKVPLKNGRYKPRFHDFRHTYAVKVLLFWHRNGDDIIQKMPILSTYLGHVEPRDTYWYLSAVPELMQLTSKKLEKYLQGIKHG